MQNIPIFNILVIALGILSLRVIFIYFTTRESFEAEEKGQSLKYMILWSLLFSAVCIQSGESFKNTVFFIAPAICGILSLIFMIFAIISRDIKACLGFTIFTVVAAAIYVAYAMESKIFTLFSPIFTGIMAVSLQWLIFWWDIKITDVIYDAVSMIQMGCFIFTFMSIIAIGYVLR